MRGRHPVSAEVSSHPMNSIVGESSCNQATKKIKQCSDATVYLNYLQSVGEEYFTAGLQLFNDKS